MTVPVPEVIVCADDLGGKASVALKDTLTEYRLIIDFSRTPEEIVAGLGQVLGEGVETGRWARQRTPQDGGDPGH